VGGVVALLGDGVGVFAAAALCTVYSPVRCVSCLTLKSYLLLYYIIISDEIFQLSHVVFIIQFLSRKYKM
jgi:fucose permease